MSEFNIEVAGGSSVRLPTAGKYCDRDIIVTAAGAGGDSDFKKMLASTRDTFSFSESDLQGITEIAGYAFYYNDRLQSIFIPEGVTTIGQRAFYYCSKLEDVTIPSTVTSIGGTAFAICQSLLTVRVKATTPPTLGGSAFLNCSNLSEIIVNAGCGDAFRSATNWSNQADIIVEVTE